MSEKIVYEGKIVSCDKVFRGQIEISTSSGLITKVTNLDEEEKVVESDKIFDDNCLIFPGMGDVHIHAREDDTTKQNYKEEYTTAANSALNGGVVHVSAMPNTPNPVISKEQLNWHKNRVEEINHPVKIFNYVGIGPGTKPVDLDVPYKAYTGPSVGPLFFKSEAELRETIQFYKGKKVSFHVEDFDVLVANENQPTHTLRRPIECVEVALEYVLKIIEEFELQAKLCHWSTGKKSFEMIKEHRERMKEKGLAYTTIEVSPLHLVFDSDKLEENPELWPYVQMNPAIQSREHRMELIEGLRTGFIDYIATDHAPHTLDEKFRNFSSIAKEGETNEEAYKRLLIENPVECKSICCQNGMSGDPWLDTYSYVALYLMSEHNFKPEDIARVTGKNPGNFVNQFLKDKSNNGFGEIKENFLGCLTVLNVKKDTILKRENLQTKVKWSPLEERKFEGDVEAVIINGVDQTNKFL